MVLQVDSELLQAGLASSAVVARGIDNTKISAELIAYRRHVGKRLASFWKKRSLADDPGLAGYQQAHAAYGVEDEPSAPEKLVMYVRRNKDFTSTGAIVDCYNIVSARTRLSIGAHDLDKLATPVTLRVCTDQDTFEPLKLNELQEETPPVAGEYGYVDPDGRVICRMDILQCEYSKTTRDTRDAVFFLQANSNLSAAALLKGSWLLAEMLERFTGAKTELVNFYDGFSDTGGGAKTSGRGKPTIEFDEFKGLDLRKGGVAEVSPLDGMPALSAVTVAVGDGEVRALTPTSALPSDASGQGVVVVCGLNPIAAGGQTFDAYLLSADGASLLSVESPIPDGTPLY